MTPTEILRKERGEMMREWRTKMKMKADDISSFLGVKIHSYYRMEQGNGDNRFAYLKMKQIFENSDGNAV